MNTQIEAAVTLYECSLHTIKVNSERNVLHQEKDPAGVVHTEKIADKQWENSAQ